MTLVMLFGVMVGDFISWVAKRAHGRGSDLIDVGRIGVVSIIY